MLVLGGNILKKRIFYLDLIRVIACFLVVMVHVSGETFGSLPIGSFEFEIANIYNCMGIIGVPLFFMISGALYLGARIQKTPVQFFIKNALPLMIAYFVSIFFYDLLSFLLNDPKDFAHLKNTVIMNVFKGSGIGVGHLWFLTIMFSIYLLIPLFWDGFQKWENCRYFLILFVSVTVIWDSVLKFDFPYHIIVQSLRGLTPYYVVTTYVGYFVLGHVIMHFFLPKISQYSSKKRQQFQFLLLVIAVVSFIFTCISNSYLCAKAKEAGNFANDPYFIGHFLTTICLFTLFAVTYYEPKQSASPSKKDVHFRANYPYRTSGACMSFLADQTLGIYLIHPAVITLLKHFAGLYLITPYPLLLIPVQTLVIAFLSALITTLYHLVLRFLKNCIK